METSFRFAPSFRKTRKVSSKAYSTSGERILKKNSLGRPKRKWRREEDFAAFERRDSFLPRTKIGSSSVAASAVVRASGPTQSSRGESGMTPSTGTRPKVGLRPAMPQRAADRKSV